MNIICIMLDLMVTLYLNSCPLTLKFLNIFSLVISLIFHVKVYDVRGFKIVYLFMCILERLENYSIQGTASFNT